MSDQSEHPEDSASEQPQPVDAGETQSGAPHLSELLDPSRLKKPNEGFTVEPKAVKRNRVMGIAQLLGLAVALAIVAIAASALTKDKGPAASELLPKMQAALKAPSLSASYTLSVSSNTETSANSFKSLAESGEKEITGVISKTNGQLALSATDASGEWELRLVGGDLYTRSGDQWIGYDLTSAQESAVPSEEGETSGPGGLATEKLESFFAEKTYAGPVVGGTQTWELSKEIDPTDLPATGNIKAPDLLDSISYSLAIGRRDSLPREASFQIAGDPNDWVLVPSDAETTIDLKLDAQLTDWNKVDPVTAPAGVSLETDLPPALIAGMPIFEQLFGSGAGGGE